MPKIEELKKRLEELKERKARSLALFHVLEGAVSELQKVVNDFDNDLEALSKD